MERTLIAPGVHLSCDPASKFNRCRISIHFAFPAQRKTATAHALLPLVMERGYADCPDMTRLTKKLAKPAVPFGGKYRIIDFPLSNCVNSGIDTVGILTQYQPLLLNEPLLDAYEANMAALGEPVVVEEANRLSTDAGNVSFRIPTLHGMLGIHGCGGVDLHTEEFAARTVTEEGREATRLGVCALAGVGYDLLTRPELLEAVRADFQRGIREQDEKGVSSSCY